MKTVTREQIDAILPFIGKFEAAGFSAGEWLIEPGHFPIFIQDDTVIEFAQALYDNEWFTFDWTKWQGSAKEYVASPEKTDSADLETIQKLLTTHVRKDRFCDGHLAAMFENGHIVALLRRLRSIREEMGE
jgi:hypothetical protein